MSSCVGYDVFGRNGFCNLYPSYNHRCPKGWKGPCMGICHVAVTANDLVDLNAGHGYCKVKLGTQQQNY